MADSGDAIILFDGVCNLCCATVRFVVKRDPQRHFRFAPFQSEAGRALMMAQGIPDTRLESVVLIEHGRAYRKSSAALRIAKRLSNAWPTLFVLIAVPPVIRDALYDFVGRRRYRWFGRTDACWIPDEPISDLFLDTASGLGSENGQDKEED